MVLKDTGMFPVTWAKGTFSNVNGKLILTNQRLVFNAGRFQDPLSALRQSHNDKAVIPLNTISSIEKGFLATITVMAGGQKYVFKGMRDAGGWVNQINTARMSTGAVSSAPQTYNAPPPPPPTAGNKFCPGCGTAVIPGNNFCGNCGARIA